MTTVRNAGEEPVWFRDDAGKHQLDPGASIDVAGDQHLAHVLSLPGVAVVTDEPQEEPAAVQEQDAGEAPRPARSRGRRGADEGGREPADDPAAQTDGEAGSRP